MAKKRIGCLIPRAPADPSMPLPQGRRTFDPGAFSSPLGKGVSDRNGVGPGYSLPPARLHLWVSSSGICMAATAERRVRASGVHRHRTESSRPSDLGTYAPQYFGNSFFVRHYQLGRIDEY
ncbi:hypothetical protein MAPG_01985 [Magnaporthiopsis poae ATCC 64411]|uniref:Uncharacterized protein n=1 Tax=Magnaporthiopsis poae (strain ATCC 64411 / 73-15) TaxID=644358 RepID=A0A0C4DQ47_MAGP6|nr:hypothetical protein MAPG_01985 [Magnaporthiopsis poae ATCC 64411]